MTSTITIVEGEKSYDFDKEDLYKIIRNTKRRVNPTTSKPLDDETIDEIELYTLNRVIVALILDMNADPFTYSRIRPVYFYPFDTWGTVLLNCYYELQVMNLILSTSLTLSFDGQSYNIYDLGLLNQIDVPCKVIYISFSGNIAPTDDNLVKLREFLALNDYEPEIREDIDFKLQH